MSSVRRIAKQRMRINATYIDAVVKAREAGVTFSAIAEAAGMSSQAAQEIVRRHGSTGKTSSTDQDQDPNKDPGDPDPANQDTTESNEKSIGNTSGVQSGVPQGAAAVRHEVGTQNPSE
ncbi:hypothetical protein [Brevibacterium paucivorans]|uniref:hypothetical protein n=1 Tax=Brevibacterium paucivorans TaxID=170994 RepID=UPI003219C5B4